MCCSRAVVGAKREVGNPWWPMATSRARGQSDGRETVYSFLPLREGTVRFTMKATSQLGCLKDEVAKAVDLCA